MLFLKTKSVCSFEQQNTANSKCYMIYHHSKNLEEIVKPLKHPKSYQSVARKAKNNNCTKLGFIIGDGNAKVFETNVEIVYNAEINYYTMSFDAPQEVTVDDPSDREYFDGRGVRVVGAPRGQ